MCVVVIIIIIIIIIIIGTITIILLLIYTRLTPQVMRCKASVMGKNFFSKPSIRSYDRNTFLQTKYISPRNITHISC